MNKKVEKAIGKALAASLVTGVAASVAAPVSAAEVDFNALYKTAYNAVTKAKAEGTQAAINEARTAINALKGTKAEFAVGEFSKQVDTVQGPKLVAIVKAIMKAQASVKQADINAAKALIEPELPTFWKNSYSQATDNVQRTLLDQVDAAVKKAAQTKTAEDIAAAKALVDDLKTAASATIANIGVEAEKALAEVKVPVKLNSVSAVTNNKVLVTFGEAVNEAPASSRFAIKDTNGTALTVSSVKVASDNKSAVLTTSAQTAYSVYTVTIDGVSKQYVAVPADTVKPTVGSAVVTASNQFKVVFGEKVDAESATNIANYSIDNNLSVLKAEIDSADSTGKTVLLTTSAQTVGTIYNITIQNVTDVAGNAMDKYTTMFGGMAKDTGKPTVTTAVVTGNTEYSITFSEKVSAETAINIANYSIDNGLTVLKADLNSAGTVVTLTTSAQTVGTIYNVTVQNVADVAGNAMDKYTAMFGGMAKDTVKPAAPLVVVTDNNKVTVTFGEKMNKDLAQNIANYSIDNNLVVLKAEIDDAGQVVTLTTAPQTVGTIYTLTVQNLADVAGNVMDKATGLFGGMAKDTAAPTASVTASANTVTVTYSEKVDTATATNVLNYVFDGSLGYATSATLDNTGRIVTLTTAAQAPGKVYTVTINGVQDLNGNTIEKDTKKTLVGIGSVAASTLTVQAVSIVNDNTVDLVFDRELGAAEVTALTVAIGKDNGAAYTLPAGSVYAKLQQSDKRVVRVQYKTGASVNPSIFLPGHVYEATITGGVIVTANSANVKSFAGTNVANAVPVATTAVALNKTAVKVTFSEPVTNLTTAEFTVTNKRTNTPVAVSNVIANGSEATLVLAAPLTDSDIYDIAFTGIAKDAAGFVSLKTTNSDASAYKVLFAGTNITNAAPKMSAVVPVDKYTFDVIFSEQVNTTGLVAGDLTLLNETDNTAVSLTGAGLVTSWDGLKLTVKLDSTVLGSYLTSGKVYKLTYATGSAHIKDVQGFAYDTADNANIVKFGGLDTANAVPEIAAATADATADTITVVFSEDVVGTIDENDFAVTVDGVALTLGGAIVVDGKTVTISSLTDFAAGKAGTVKVVAGSDIYDANRQVAKNDTVTFGTK